MLLHGKRLNKCFYMQKDFNKKMLVHAKIRNKKMLIHAKRLKQKNASIHAKKL